MAWQRLLRVGVCAVAFASFACVDGSHATEDPAPAADVAPRPTKKPLRAVKAAKRHHHVKAKTVAPHKAKAGSIKSAKRAVPAHPGGRKTGQVGYASWYGGESHGKRTASGGRFDKNELTAAHRTLPLQSKARVTNMANGRSVTVRITDRGPSRKGRIIDLSQSAAEELGMRHSGVARVHVEPVTTSVAR